MSTEEFYRKLVLIHYGRFVRDHPPRQAMSMACDAATEAIGDYLTPLDVEFNYVSREDRDTLKKNVHEHPDLGAKLRQAYAHRQEVRVAALKVAGNEYETGKIPKFSAPCGCVVCNGTTLDDSCKDAYVELDDGTCL